MIIEEQAQNPERAQIKPNTLNRSQRRLIITFILVIGDTLTLGAAFLAAYYLRFELMRGNLDESVWKREAELVRKTLRETNKPHLHAFLDAWK